MKSKNPLNQPLNSYFLALVIDGKDVGYYRMEDLKTLREEIAVACIPGAAIKRRRVRATRMSINTHKEE